MFRDAAALANMSDRFKLEVAVASSKPSLARRSFIYLRVSLVRPILVTLRSPLTVVLAFRVNLKFRISLSRFSLKEDNRDADSEF